MAEMGNETKALKIVFETKKEIQDDVKKTLIPIIKSLEEISDNVKEIGERDFDKASELLKPIIKLRTKTESARKAMKDDFLKTGKAIDECAKFVQSLIIPIEDKLKKIVATPEREENERKKIIFDQRKTLLAPYEPVDIIGIRIENLDPERFDKFLDNAKKLHGVRVAEELEKEEQEKKALEALEIVAVMQKSDVIRSNFEALNQQSIYTDNITGKVLLKTVDICIRMDFTSWKKTDFSRPIFLIVEDHDGFENQIEVEKIGG